MYFLLAVLIWGTDAGLTKAFLVADVPAPAMFAVRMTFASLALMPFAWKHWPDFRKLSLKSWLELGVLVVIGVVVMNVVYTWGLVTVPSYLAVILFRLEPILVILISFTFLNKKYSPLILVLTLAALTFAAVATLGGKLLGGGGLTLDPKGIMLVLLATLSSALATLAAKDLLRVMSPLVLTSVRTTFAALILLSFTAKPLVTEIIPRLSAGQIGLLVLLGVVFSGFAFWLYYEGLERSTPLLASLMQLIRIPTGIVTGYFLLAEVPGTMQWIGTTGIVLTLIFITLHENKAADRK
ncbi:MAG TPA: DMT family transporter [Bellilinea sp.]|nr:DMT family transporter [Bellilinea sp.]